MTSEDLIVRKMYSNIGGSRRPGMRDSYTEVYHVTNWDRDQLAFSDIYNAPGLPQRGAVQDQANVGDEPMPAIYCTDVELRALDPQRIVEARVTWREDPLDLPIVVHTFALPKLETVWMDVNGTIPQNTAGDPYNPPLERVRGCTRIEVLKRFSLNQWCLFPIENYVKHKNAAPWKLTWKDSDFFRHTTRTWPKGTVYLDDIRAPEILEPVCHVAATFVFLIDTRDYSSLPQARTYNQKQGWIHPVPNAGGRYKKDGGSTYIQFINDPNSVQANGIGMLKQDGDKVTPGGTIYWDFVDDIPDANFNDIPLSE